MSPTSGFNETWDVNEPRFTFKIQFSALHISIKGLSTHNPPGSVTHWYSEKIRHWNKWSQNGSSVSFILTNMSHPVPEYDPARGRVSRESESSRGESRSLVGWPRRSLGVAGCCTPNVPQVSVCLGCTVLYTRTQLQFTKYSQNTWWIATGYECTTKQGVNALGICNTLVLWKKSDTETSALKKA